MKIIIPKRRVDARASRNKPLFFLAGPIRGGDDWQKRMVQIIRSRSPRALIASPVRWSGMHQLAQYFAEGPDDFARQLDWERFYLELAGESDIPGCIVFWLPLESTVYPHPGPEPYAMDTRGELGEWRYRMKANNARLVIGAEEGFLGLSQIQRNFSAVLGYEFPICDSMEATADAAVAMASRA